MPDYDDFSTVEFLRMNVFRAADQNILPDNCGCH